MNEGLIPRRYAKALYLVASGRGLQEDVYSVLKTAERQFAQLPALSTALNNPYVSESDKTALLMTLFSCDNEGVKSLLADFVKLLIRNRRVGLSRLVIQSYIDIYRSERHINDVAVQSATRLSEAERKRLIGLVEKSTQCAVNEYSFTENPDLIGGFTVSVGNKKIDASVSNELKQLRLNLLSK